MVLIQKEIEAVLQKSLPNLSDVDVRKAAKSITEATGEWKEIDTSNLGASLSVQCCDICALGEAHDKGLRIRAFVLKKN